MQSSQRDQLEDLVRRVFAEDPIGYYKTPWLRSIFSKKEELECLIQYHLRTKTLGQPLY